MKPRRFRLVAAVILLGFLFVFFAPIVYSASLFACHFPSGCVFCPMCLTNPAGLESVGWATAGWGATYGFETGYNGPTVQLGTTTLTTAGLLIFIVIPVVIATLFVISPELVRVGAEIKSRFSRRSGARKPNPTTTRQSQAS